MNFNQIIKEEWEKEFHKSEVDTYEDSLFTIYKGIVEKICIRVWNEAVQQCIESVTLDEDGFGDTWINKESLINCKINEQRTDTTEV